MKAGKLERKYLSEFIYGGIDGVVTTFAIVSGSLGASLSSSIILILGFANLFADGFSMAVSNYLSIKSQKELHRFHKDKRKFYKNPLKAGFATFLSFFFIGLVPLLSFIFALFFQFDELLKFSLSVVLTGVALFSVGMAKGKIVKSHPLKSGFGTLIIGGIAALLAFIVGYILRDFVI